MSSIAPSAFFFPLRSNVGYFETSDGQLALLNQIKQASLLYDRLIFQDGTYRASIAETGSFDVWTPRSDEGRVQEAQPNVEPTIDIRPLDGQTSVLIKIRDKYVPLVAGKTIRTYYSDFNTVLDSINADLFPWIERADYELGDNETALQKTLRESFEQTLEQTLPLENSYVRVRVADNLSKDLVLSALLKTPLSIQAQHMPLLLASTNGRPASGFSAFRARIPDLTHLPWNEIVDLRNEPSMIELRQLLLKIEQAAEAGLTDGGIDEAKRQAALQRAWADEALADIEHSQPKTLGSIGHLALDFVLGSVPVVGPLFGALKEMQRHHDASTSWKAAFLKLKKPEE
jgi:hypothetical protein